MKPLLLILAASLLNAATETVCNSGCTYTSLQTAMATTACGNTLAVKSTDTQTGNFTITYRGCSSGTPITVTTDRASFLPPSTGRVTPSQLGNLARVQSTSSSDPVLQGVLDGSNRPPAHWKFIGVAFTTTSSVFDIIGFNAAGTATGSSQIADDITFDRCYFGTSPIWTAQGVANVIRGDVTNLTVKNSYFGDAFLDGTESHGLSVLTSAGPFTFTNNFVTASSIPVFVGGATPSYPAYLANGATVNYNYLWRPWKWNSDPTQPFYADYLADQATGAHLVCTKNLGELKWGVGVTWQYNVGENSWWYTQCGAQFTGFTDTLRTETDTTTSNPNIGTFAMSDTTHITWTGAYRIGGFGAASTSTQDLGVCIQVTAGTECKGITSFSGASLVAASPFSSAPGGALQGGISYAASAQLTNLTMTHNAWKNADQTLSILALSPSNGTGNDGFGKNHTISQNLWYANTSYIGPHAKGASWSGAEMTYVVKGSGYTFDHNTFYYPTGFLGGAFIYMSSAGPVFDTSAITNNLFGTQATGGNGPFSGDGVGNTISTANLYFSNSNIKNNAIPGGSQSGSVTGGNAVSGNIYSAWADPFGGTSSSGVFNVVSSSPYYHAGTDGASLGADFTQLPLISNLAVTPGGTTATLAFSLNPVNNDIKATQVCELEVSTSRNLISDLGTYTVIASLDPTLTIGADLSTQAGVTIASNNVTWAITGLVNSTLYYGRLQCYGDTQTFSFTTSTSVLTCSPKTHVTPPTVTDIQLQTNMALGIVACTNPISGACDATSVQRVVNAALGGACVVGP